MKPNLAVCKSWLDCAITGSNYWGKWTKYSASKGTARIVEYGDENEPIGTFDVTPETFRKGFEVITRKGFDIDRNIIQWAVLDIKDGEGGDMDSYGADAILQAGLWGEVRYG